MNLNKFAFSSLILSLLLTSCSPDQQHPSDFDHETNTILWENVGSEFNPQSSQNDVDIKDVEKILVNVPSAADKVIVKYSTTLPANTAIVKIFTISKDSLTSSNFRRGRRNNTIEMSDPSQPCKLTVENGHIKDVNGYCYARIEIHLRENAPVEVYSGSKIITDHYYPVSLADLMKRLEDCHEDSERLAQVADFSSSYSETGVRIPLYTTDLVPILRKFQTTNPKLQVLRLVQIYIVDRDQLEKMIEEEFEYFDRAEARKIVGLGV
ncbi:hypothetical protein DOM22_12035 [Bdellovibrio sp. ZAP7]|uniref:DUF4476 domain-containing protein n=1 Tax=Bdellovibrio sp. ZAP7 TaxID=2231053 RepID=UPI001158F5F0|nr:DUF4476 domain-containing protein [Bdellovibrio sp. ZAP7]QDK45826.1 hypothetical protein DOM22_12035 [Bdellovibrio sp. ZAP7]